MPTQQFHFQIGDKEIFNQQESVLAAFVRTMEVINSSEVNTVPGMQKTN
jgi:hypothetical protein